MNSTTLFFVIISILIINFIIDKILATLNEKYFDKKIPEELSDIYDQKEYEKSQAYKKTSAKFSKITSFLTTLLTLVFFLVDGFKFLDIYARTFTNNPVLIALIFFGIIIISSTFLSIPISYYNIFVIEEKFGFNKSSKKIFCIDKIKGLFISIILGGGILSLVIWFYQLTGSNFWRFIKTKFFFNYKDVVIGYRYR